MRVSLVLGLALVACALPAAARAGVANAGLPGATGDPLAGMRWGTYSGPQDEVFPAYRAATGDARRLLGLIALRPRMRWFGAWYADDQIRATISQYLANTTHRNPSVLAQVAVFRLVPWEGAACHALPTAGQQASFRAWVANLAAGIGAARVALVLQPDLPFANCIPGHSTLPLSMVAEAARVLSALPHTTVYIDAGAADWVSPARAATILRQAGVGDTRGFALNATHYGSTSDEITYGRRVVGLLAAAHIPGRHFVINTSSNGHPFTFQQYHAGDFDNATVCANRQARHCASLGIPPTADVANPRWGLAPGVRATAARLVDAYLWIGRPWLDQQSDPFDLARSLALARSSPF